MPERSVLLVDDNIDVRTLLRETLLADEEHTYYVHEAENGERAVEFLTEHHDDVDVVILDVEMPITDGWETLKIIRDDENGWPEVKVVMLTVQRTLEKALKSWINGADKYIKKPFAVQQVTDAIEMVLTPDDDEEKSIEAAAD